MKSTDLKERLLINPDMWKVIQRIHLLKGKNLACWCPLDQLCHADLLLKIANE